MEGEGLEQALRPVMVPAVFGILAEQLGLQGEDVVQHAIDPPSLQPVVRDHAGVLEVAPQGAPERPVHASLSSDLRLFEDLQTPVERTLPGPVGPDAHSVPSTSTRPAVVTRTLTLLRA